MKADVKMQHSQVPLPNWSAPFMNDVVVSVVKGLNPYKALGHNELHPRVLKERASELGPVFAHLFQQFVDTGEITKEWSIYMLKKEIGLWLAVTVRSP